MKVECINWSKVILSKPIVQIIEGRSEASSSSYLRLRQRRIRYCYGVEGGFVIVMGKGKRGCDFFDWANIELNEREKKILKILLKKVANGEDDGELWKVEAKYVSTVVIYNSYKSSKDCFIILILGLVMGPLTSRKLSLTLLVRSLSTIDLSKNPIQHSKAKH
ncbi:hypothetical protein CR513_29879, partial [Mucuna pruriens]